MIEVSDMVSFPPAPTTKNQLSTDKNIQFHPTLRKKMDNQIMLNHQKHLIRKIPNIVALALLTLTISPAMAAPNNVGSPDILPPNANFQGLSYSEWSVEWFKWAYSLQLTHHPLTDTADCGAGQAGNVWFIDGTPAGGQYPTEGRDCTIPPGTALFLAIKAASWDNEACSADPVPVIQKTNYTEEILRSFAQRDLIINYGFREITIDEVNVAGLPEACDPNSPQTCESPYRVQTPVFDYTVPATDNTLTLFNGACYDDPNNNGQPYTVSGTVGDGYYVLIKPLPIGTHTIRFGAIDPITKKPNRLYNITVSEQAHGRKDFH